MYKIHGFNISSNTTKTVYTAEELGVEYEYIQLDMTKGEHKTPEHFKRHPFGKAPTLTHDGATLFESGAICRYMASRENTHLYPLDDHLKRCRIDQWMDFFTIHLGRWLNTYAFEKVAKEKFGFGTPDKAIEKEALGFIEQQIPAVDKLLGEHQYFLGDTITIADLFAFAYMENAEMADLSLESTPNLRTWYVNLKKRESIVRAYKRLNRDS